MSGFGDSIGCDEIGVGEGIGWDFDERPDI